jgi:hypothetical protein
MVKRNILNSKRNRHSAGKISIHLLIVSAIFVLGAIYLYQVSSMVSQTYAMRSVQKEFQDLQDQYKKTETEINQCQSLPKLEAAAKNLNLTTADNISYLDLSQGKVAVNLTIDQP